MPQYMFLLRFHDRGLQNIKDSHKRTERIVEVFGSMGAQITGYWMTTGHYDGVLLIEAPDDVTVAKLRLVGPVIGGSDVIEVLRALTPEENNAVIEGLQPGAATAAAVSRGDAMEAQSAQQTGVALLREGEVEWVTLRPNIEVSRTITAAGISELGGGILRSTGKGGEILDWTLHYDEVFYVERGELEVETDGVSTVAGPGEGILIAKGTKVTYRTKPHTRAFYVLYPIDWQQRSGVSID